MFLILNLENVGSGREITILMQWIVRLSFFKNTLPGVIMLL